MASQIGREHLRRHWRKYLLLFVVLPISFLVANGIASALLLLFISRSDGVGKMQHGAVHHQTPILAQQDSNVNNSPAAQDRKAELKHLWDFEWSYSGIPTFAHLPYHKCLIEPDVAFDVGIIGAPFDTAVSYRTGARFGPRAIRAASSRQSRARGWNHRAKINPYKAGLKIIDCGDIPLVPIDNAIALKQMTQAMTELGSRASALTSAKKQPPRLLTLGGDHSVALGALRALRQLHGRPITVLHFDAHLDTWIPPSSAQQFPWFSEPGRFNHGDVFALAWEEGLIANGTSAHVGLRTRLSGPEDLVDDSNQGFMQVYSDEVDDIGTHGIIERVKKRLGKDSLVYLSFDIDVVDPGLAPGTGTPEPSGFTSREVIRLLRGLEGLNIVGADIVEVSPAYDGPGEQTALVAAQVAFEILTNWAIAAK